MFTAPFAFMAAPVGGVNYLLDDYPGSSGAFSLRKLSSSYTGYAIRVRRSSDNTQQDIGFVDQDLDTSALTSFVGAGDGFITIWYDQSGNNLNCEQVTVPKQPLIVSSGTILTSNGKPAIYFNGSTNGIDGATYGLYLATCQSYYSINEPEDGTGFRTIFTSHYAGTGSMYVGILNSNSKRYQYWIEGTNNTSSSIDITYSQMQVTGYFEDATTNGIKRYLNGSLDTEYTLDYGNGPQSNQFGIGYDPIDNNYFWKGYQQELVFYPTINSGNRIAIETNQTTYW